MGNASPPRESGAYPHLDDLVARAVPQVNINVPMKTLLQRAHGSAKQADTFLEFKRPELAYVEYLTAANIIVDLVPRHKDFPSLNTDRGELWRLNKDLQNRIISQHKKFDEVRERIKLDNSRSGIKATARPNGQIHVSQPHHDRENASLSRKTEEGSKNTLKSPVIQGLQEEPGTGSIAHAYSRNEDDTEDMHCGIKDNRSQLRASNAVKRKPVVVAKPEALKGQVIYSGEPYRPKALKKISGDTLVERFARLRGNDELRPMDLAPAEVGRLVSADNICDLPYSARAPSPVQYTPSSSTSSLSVLPQSVSAPGMESPKQTPLGPRIMPTRPNGIYTSATLPPPTHAAHPLPRPPSPTYSPARNFSPQPNIDPPRITARSTMGISKPSRPLVPAYTISGPPDPRKTPPNRQSISLEGRDIIAQAKISLESAITAENLLHYFQTGSEKHSVLLIDTRSREAFDDGHIFARSIICVESIGLRPTMSADDLEQALVLSPEYEQQLFHQRHLFDLVVYYDQSSTSDTEAVVSQPSSENAPLSALRRALCEFNYDKPLKRPPALLVGGLDAWIDLVGRQALKSTDRRVSYSREAISLGAQQRVAERSSLRNSENGNEADKKSRSHAPLNHQEEEAWIERVRVEGGERALSRRTPSVKEGRPTNVKLVPENAAISPSILRTYDDFLRRFPEPTELKESMITQRTPLERSVIDHPFHNFTGVQAPRRKPVSSVAAIPVPLSRPPSRPPPAVPRQSYSGVSERGSYQAPASSRPPPVAPSISSLPDIAVPSRSEYQVGRTGLTNFGATCYMNAVTQCLSATSPLTRYFLDGSYKDAVQRTNKFGSNGVLPEVYSNLMWQLWDGKSTSISPKEFISRLNSDFKNPDVQHDANDFFVFLLDALHEDLNVNYSRNRLNDLTPAEERRRESLPVQIASRVEWNRWSHLNLSWVSRLFSGQHMSRLRCPVCGFTSTSYETFYSISLEIPRKGKAHIYDCFKNYTMEERLGADDSWTCPNCKLSREASKQITITRAPQILVIQLKRFKSVRRGFTDKNNTLIDFPLTKLDLTPFSVSPLNPQARQEAEIKLGTVLEPEHETTPPFEYDAYGVVQHFGTLTGGHYTALIRGGARGQWLVFNDKVVSNFDPRNVPSAAAYLLFFVRSSVQ